MYKSNLLVEWYDRLTENVTTDIDIYLNEAKISEHPVLELACGTGRILMELLKNGIETHGLDLSDEMLEICRKKLESESLSTKLYQNNMANFDLSDKNYGMIFCSRASFQMLENLEDAYSALMNIYRHLKEDGVFITDIFMPWQGIIENNRNIWVMGPVAESGDQKLICQSTNNYDLENQKQHTIYKYELYESSYLKETMLEEYRMRWYGKEEFLLMLEKTGFQDIEIRRTNIFQGYDHGFLVKAWR